MGGKCGHHPVEVVPFSAKASTRSIRRSHSSSVSDMFIEFLGSSETNNDTSTLPLCHVSRGVVVTESDPRARICRPKSKFLGHRRQAMRS